VRDFRARRQIWGWKSRIEFHLFSAIFSQLHSRRRIQCPVFACTAYFPYTDRMTLTELAIESCGWLGAALILGAYILVSIGKLDGRSKAFQWMNVVGAAGFIVNSGYNGALPSAVLNVIWVCIGLATLWSLRQRQ
jgi:hypothetical protein